MIAVAGRIAVAIEREQLLDLSRAASAGLPVSHSAIARQSARLSAAKRAQWLAHQAKNSDGRPVPRAAV